MLLKTQVDTLHGQTFEGSCSRPDGPVNFFVYQCGDVLEPFSGTKKHPQALFVAAI
jgi:hypothetical protein